MKTIKYCYTTHKTDSSNDTQSFEDDTVCPAPELDQQNSGHLNGTMVNGTETSATDIIWNEKDKADILGAYFIGYRYKLNRIAID